MPIAPRMPNAEDSEVRAEARNREMNANSPAAVLVARHRSTLACLAPVDDDEATNRLAEKLVPIEGEIPIERSLGSFVGRSRPLRTVLRQVEIVAPTASTALISGETRPGT